MTELRPRAALRRAVHGVCVADGALGWAACLTAWKIGLAVHALVGDRIRVVVAEADGADQYGVDVGQLRTAAVKLAVDGYSAKRSIDLLHRVLARRGGDDPTAGPSLILLDLYESGYVEAAWLNTPPVAHVRPARGPLGQPGTHATTVVAGDGEAVLAMTPGVARLMAPDAVTAVAAKSSAFADPCQLRDDLLRRTDAEAPTLPAPPMAVLVRPA